MKFWFNAFVCMVLLGCYSLALAQPGTKTQSGPDRGKEDAVAKLFETIRASHGLRPLTRIKSRKELEQQNCTRVVRNVPANDGRQPTRLGLGQRIAYVTATPEKATPALESIASFTWPKNGTTRYAVSVWPTKEGAADGQQQYSVSVALYRSALGEWFEDTFTDEMFYKNDWKKSVAPDCRHSH